MNDDHSEDAHDYIDGVPPLFYARCSHESSFQSVRRIILQCDSLQDATAALYSRDLVIHVLIQAQRPAEDGFRYRPDGTILVGASAKAQRLEVYGPFNDESDAKRWIALQPKGRSYTLIEPDECLHYARVNGVLTEITLPPSLFSDGC